MAASLVEEIKWFAKHSGHGIIGADVRFENLFEVKCKCGDTITVDNMDLVHFAFSRYGESLAPRDFQEHILFKKLGKKLGSREVIGYGME